MMRSLWAGVSGLQAHQIAMDVEANNIANVNTAGFKYGRASFADMLSQTRNVATAPQGEMGGKNPMQIGLGTSIQNIDNIFSQGSIQTTDKNTDVAIQGDGFFIISPDGGNTYKYTRDGDFKFDGNGNFVNNGGYIIQGWMRDRDTMEIDTSAAIQNIQIRPGMTTPAQATSEIALKANLNSGDLIESKGAVKPLKFFTANSVEPGVPDVDGFYLTDKTGEYIMNDDIQDKANDVGVLFNTNGEALNVRNGEGIWMSYAPAELSTNILGNTLADGDTVSLEINGATVSYTNNTGSVLTATQLGNAMASAVNTTSSEHGVRASFNATTGAFILTNSNDSGTTEARKNVRIGAVTASGTAFGTFAGNESITAYKYTYDSTGTSGGGTYDTNSRNFKTTADLLEHMQNDARYFVDYTGDGSPNAAGYNATGAIDMTGLSAGDTIDVELNGTAYTFTYDGTDWDDTNNAAAAGFNVTIDSSAPATTAITVGSTNSFTINSVNGDVSGAPVAGTAGATTGYPASVEFGITNEGAITVKNPDDAGYNMNFAVTGFSSGSVAVNPKFADIFTPLTGNLTAGSTGSKMTQRMYAATHSASIDVYDSLGTRHTVRMEFTKKESTTGGGSTWDMIVTIPRPATFTGTDDGPYSNMITNGTVTFNNTGSLSTFTPPSFTFSPNNGAEPDQTVIFDFGLGDFDGVTSFNKPSSNGGISQDGFTGGDLLDIRIDQSGTLIGSFSNGRSFGLAQLAMAKFANNQGLSNDGNNMFVQSANSGDPIVGVAATGGKGFIQSSALEMSNVDLSRSLTQLIVVQRGFQANGKTITTSDQMLQELLQIKR